MSDFVNQFSIARIKLDQSKYKKGYMYISTLVGTNKEKILDFRYFVDDNEIFIPTNIGFRISGECVKDCLSELLEDYKEIDVTCCLSKSKKLKIRHLNGQYGEAVDVRYYLTTDAYDGWSYKGIRFSVNNYIELQNHIRVFLDKELNTVNYKNLFQGKIISPKYPKKNLKAEYCVKKTSSKKAGKGKYVASELESIINSKNGS